MKLELTREAVDWFFARDYICFADVEKAKLICKLRLEGETYEHIGSLVGLTKSRVREYVCTIMRRYNQYKNRVKYNAQG